MTEGFKTIERPRIRFYAVKVMHIGGEFSTPICFAYRIEEQLMASQNLPPFRPIHLLAGPVDALLSES